MTGRSYDVVIVGGGHNGLVAAGYLGGAGLSVLVAERLDHSGGAAVSARPWPGVDARLSRYSYLVSLLPDRIVSDLRLPFTARTRRIGSYTPTVRNGSAAGLLVGSPEQTAASFRALTGGASEYQRYGDLSAGRAPGAGGRADVSRAAAQPSIASARTWATTSCGRRSWRSRSRR